MYLGKMIEVTREAPANLGTAMKTIIARFEDMKKDPMAILEDGVSANKVEAALATIGIALRDTAGEFRPLQDVMDELGMKWDSLTRNQQAYIATVAAGSRQQSRFLALMNNYDRTLDLITESQNSAGAAAEQYAIYQDSAAAATARLTAAWEEFYSKIVNSEQIIWVINALEKLVETMSKIGPIGTAIGTTIGALGLNLLGKAVIPNITKNLANVVSTGQAASLSIGALAKGGKALLLTFGKAAAVIAVVVGAVLLAVKAWQALDKAFHKDREEAKQLANNIKDLNEKISENGEKTKSLEELLKKYEELNNKAYRTKEQQEELNETINKINEISDNAIISIDKLGNAHLHNKEAVEAEYKQTKEYNDYLEKQKLQKQIQFLQDTPEEERTKENLQNAGLNKLAELEDIPTLQENKEELKQMQELLNYAKQIDTGAFDYENLNLLSKDQITRFEERAVNKYNEEKGTNYNYSDEIIAEDSQEYTKILNELISDYAVNRISQLEDAISQAENFGNKQNETYIELASKYAELYGGENGGALSDFIKNGNIIFESEEEFLNFIDNFSNIFSKNNIKQIEKYNNGEISLDELIKSLGDSEEFLLDKLGEKLKKDSEDAANELENRTQQRYQFLGDNVSILNKDLKEKLFSKYNSLAEGYNDFAHNDNISSSDLDYLGTFLKLNISDDSKVSLFDFIIKDEDDQFQALGNKYIKSVENGITDESEQLRQQIVDILTLKGVPQEDIINILRDFVPTYTELMTAKADEDFSDFNTTRKGVSDLTSLKSKQRKQFLSDNSNADQYFEYNDEGEEYLNILGKIVLLEQQRSDAIRDIDNLMAGNNAQIADNEEKIKDINNHLDTATDDELSLLKTMEEENNSLREQNQLQQKRRDYINDSVNLQEYESMALQNNVNEAQKHADNIKTIAKVWAEYQNGSLSSNLEAINSLNQLDASYQSLFMTVSSTGEEIFTLNQDIVDKMIANEEGEYQAWRAKEVQKLEDEATILEMRMEYLRNWLEGSNETYDMDAENKEAAAKLGAQSQTQAETDGFQTGTLNATKYYQGLDELAKSYFQDVTTWANDVYSNITNPEQIQLSDSTLKIPELKVDTKINFEDIDWDDRSDDNKALVQKLLEQYEQRYSIIKATIAKLGDLSPEFEKVYNNTMNEAAKGSKEAAKALEAMTKAAEDLAEAIEDLDKLVKDVKVDLDDISVDYNPFTDLFEAWEHEWDYYYNIKRLIAEIGTQGQIIDNIISADYVSADKRVQAYHAKIGNLLGEMAANDTYILSLRAGLAQKGEEIMEKYGDYYKIDPETGQIYQTDKNLTDINDAINQTGQEIYDLQKLQNEKENDLAVENSKLDALEKEKSAYEEILSTIDSQIKSLKENKDITADTTELENQKAEIEAKLEITDDSIEETKDKINELEDGIQDIEVEIELKENLKEDMIDYQDDMSNAVSEYQSFIDAINEAIMNQQMSLQELTEVYNTYVETAINTQQQLYDAIVENYQREIDAKKKEYDELKQLDNEYLQSVKDNIAKEREAREDSKKQKSYQQSLQRAQLLQMDTSGAFRTELNELKNSIEQQREDLYDDLVDKQVEALEKEIEKRHELYDKEVAALEERLAYMQENASLLWEMVNEIVAQGSEAMMSTLEGTMEYINSTELSRQQQRKAWENNIALTFDGVKNGVIDTLNNFIKAGDAYIEEELPEINKALEDYEEVFQAASKAMMDYTTGATENTTTLKESATEGATAFTNILTDFMTNWNERTNQLTGYSQNWETTINNLKSQVEEHTKNIKNYFDKEGKAREELVGSIGKTKEELEKTYDEIYDDFISERQRYRDELESLIQTIQTEIESAVKDAAEAIRSAIDSLTAGSGSGDGGDSGGGGGGSNTPTNPEPNPGEGGNGDNQKYDGWQVQYLLNGEQKTYTQRIQGGVTWDEILNMFETFRNLIWKTDPQATFWNLKHLKTGGLVNFTGPAWLDGTASSPERVLSPHQTKLFESMVSSLERASNNSNINSALGSSYNIGDINTSIQVAKLDNQTDINQLAKQVEDKIVKTIRNRVTISV